MRRAFLCKGFSLILRIINDHNLVGHVWPKFYICHANLINHIIFATLNLIKEYSSLYMVYEKKIVPFILEFELNFIYLFGSLKQIVNDTNFGLEC